MIGCHASLEDHRDALSLCLQEVLLELPCCIPEDMWNIVSSVDG